MDRRRVPLPGRAAVDDRLAAGKYYGIEIAVDDSLGSVRYTGAFPLEQKITEVLETLNFEKRFTVVQHGNDFALEKSEPS